MSATEKNKKPKTSSGTASGTGKKTNTAPDLIALVAAAQAAGVGNTTGTAKGPVFTTQDAKSYVESVYQQMLGRSASGAERTKGINAFLNQSTDTDVTGRQQVLVDMIQQTPEFRRRQENRYLDAIYNEVASDVRRAQA